MRHFKFLTVEQRLSTGPVVAVGATSLKMAIRQLKGCVVIMNDKLP